MLWPSIPRPYSHRAAPPHGSNSARSHQAPCRRSHRRTTSTSAPKKSGPAPSTLRPAMTDHFSLTNSGPQPSASVPADRRKPRRARLRNHVTARPVPDRCPESTVGVVHSLTGDLSTRSPTQLDPAGRFHAIRCYSPLLLRSAELGLLIGRVVPSRSRRTQWVGVVVSRALGVAVKRFRRITIGALLACAVLALGVGPAGSLGAQVTRGDFAPFAAGAGLSISGHAQMVRTADGTTIVTIHVEGLQPGVTYDSHVHAAACSAAEAGGHYNFGHAVSGGRDP